MLTAAVSGIAQAIGSTQLGRIEIGKNEPEKKNIGVAISVNTRVKNVMCGAVAENKNPNVPKVIPTMIAGIIIPIASQLFNQPKSAATTAVPATVIIDLVTAHKISPMAISVIVIGVVSAVS